MLTAFPVLQIESHNLILREINVEQDAASYFNYTNQPQVNRFLQSNDIPSSIPAAQNALSYWQRLFTDNASSIFWTIARRDNNAMIGTCGFNYWSQINRRVEISYDLAVEYWGKGIMTEIVRRVCKYALEDLNVMRIQATVAINNYASMRVLDKIGFKNEGKMQNFAILHNKVYDYYMYALCPQPVK